MNSDRIDIGWTKNGYVRIVPENPCSAFNFVLELLAAALQTTRFRSADRDGQFLLIGKQEIERSISFLERESARHGVPEETRLICADVACRLRALDVERKLRVDDRDLWAKCKACGASLDYTASGCDCPVGAP